MTNKKKVYVLRSPASPGPELAPPGLGDHDDVESPGPGPPLSSTVEHAQAAAVKVFESELSELGWSWSFRYTTELQQSYAEYLN